LKRKGRSKRVEVGSTCNKSLGCESLKNCNNTKLKRVPFQDECAPLVSQP
jgi:hypothetical protein